MSIDLHPDPSHVDPVPMAMDTIEHFVDFEDINPWQVKSIQTIHAAKLSPKRFGFGDISCMLLVGLASSPDHNSFQIMLFNNTEKLFCLKNIEKLG